MSGIDSYGRRRSKIKDKNVQINSNQFNQQSTTERNRLTETSGIDSYGLVLNKVSGEIEIEVKGTTVQINRP